MTCKRVATGNDYKIASGPVVEAVLKQKVAIAEALAFVKSNGVNCEAGADVGADVVPVPGAKPGDDSAPGKGPLPAGPIARETLPDVRVRKGKKVKATKRRCTNCQPKVNGKCGGRSAKSVRGCCGHGVMCVRRNRNSAVCKNLRSKGGRAAMRRFKKRGFGQRLHCYTGGE